MKLEVLMSCMHQTDFSLVKESCITSDILIINQAEGDSIIEQQIGSQKIRMMTTTERGLSRSRNMAIQNATGDICLLCDDDEQFVDGYEEIILETFRNTPDADVIAFNIRNKVTRLNDKLQRIGFLGCLKIASYQIAFRRKAILDKEIQFDPLMGAGSGNGGGEENKFLWDCLRSGLNVYFSPSTIAAVLEKTSTWFFGYDKTFFYQRGAATRYMMGGLPSIFYGIYYLIRKYALYKENIGMVQASKQLFRGITDNPIKYQKRNQCGDGQ